jgi:hypothetical protein
MALSGKCKRVSLLGDILCHQVDRCFHVDLHFSFASDRCATAPGPFENLRPCEISSLPRLWAKGWSGLSEPVYVIKSR